MKHIIYPLAGLLLLLASCASSDEQLAEETRRGFQGDEQTEVQLAASEPDSVFTGRTVPSVGTLRISLIFSRFESDEADMGAWNEMPGEDPADVPGWMRRFISENGNDTEGRNEFQNVTNFFDQASLGKMKVYGRSYYVSLPDSLRGGLAGPANRAAIQKVFGDGEGKPSRAGVPLNSLDNWHTPSYGVHVRESNGIIDYTVVVHRWNRNTPHPFNAGWSGFAGLGGGSYPVDEGLQVMGFGPNVSGATAMFTDGYRGLTNTVHEIGHHLLGNPHPYLGNGGTHPAYWSLFESYIANLSVNAWEREFLGWNEMYRIEDETRRITLRDFYTTGDAAAVELDDGSLLVFENRQKLSTTDGLEPTYDNATMNHDDKGLFVYQVAGAYSTRRHDLRTFPADGHYVWDIAGWNNACGSRTKQPVLVKREQHPLGVSYRDAFVIDLDHFGQEGRNPFALFIYGDEDPDRCHTYTRGIHFETAFGPGSLSGKRIFSPFTNPASLLENGEYTGLSFVIHRETGGEGEMNITFSRDPFFRDMNGPLRVDQDLFFSESVVLPEGTEWHLDEGVRLYLHPEASLRIDGILMLPDGRALTGLFTLSDLQALPGLNAKPLGELNPHIGRAKYK